MLQAWSRGDQSALDQHLPAVDAELWRRAGYYMRRQPPGHTLRPVLVHEAYLRLIGSEPVEWHSRAHFFGVAAKAMRSIKQHCSTARAWLRRELTR